VESEAMRALVLTAFCIPGIGATAFAPFLGVLMWHWLSLMKPHAATYGFTMNLPIVMVCGAVTLLAWVFSREPKRLPMTPANILMIAFTLWISLTTMYAALPDRAFDKWIELIKIMGMILVTTAMVTTRNRIMALVWIGAMSIGFWGIKGGILTILSGGSHKIFGPTGTIIEDNNQLGLALLMVLPLWLFLAEIQPRRWLKSSLLGGAGMITIATVMTYSRGALLGLATLGLLVWVTSRRKISTAIVVGGAIFLAAPYIPEAWYARMNTIENYEGEGSAESRLMVWQQAIAMSKDSPIVGFGFKSFLDYRLVEQYRAPEFMARQPMEAHSIYFQLLGEQGMVGLGIFLALGGVSIFTLWRVFRETKAVPEMFWANRLARAMMLGICVFAVSGAFLSNAYFDLYYFLVAVVVGLRVVVRKGEYLPPGERLDGILESLGMGQRASIGRLQPGKPTNGREAEPGYRGFRPR
jgi:putative inorganic carbon (hco3(-)) transporter